MRTGNRLFVDQDRQLACSRCAPDPLLRTAVREGEHFGLGVRHANATFADVEQRNFGRQLDTHEHPVKYRNGFGKRALVEMEPCPLAVPGELERLAAGGGIRHVVQRASVVRPVDAPPVHARTAGGEIELPAGLDGRRCGTSRRGHAQQRQQDLQRNMEMRFHEYCPCEVV